MLYDPKWEIKINTPWSLDRLAAWLKLQPARKRYCYSNIGHCLLAQYLTDCDYPIFSVGPYQFHYIGPDNSLIREIIPVQFNQIAISGNHTFGAAYRRTRRRIFWINAVAFFHRKIIRG